MANAPVAEPKPTTPARPTPVPPEEQFWIRYSPHNEAPLSGVSSTVLHVLFVLLVLLVIWIKNKLDPDEEKKPIPTEAIRIVDAPSVAIKDNGGGGGGDKKGRGDGPGIRQKGSDDLVEKGTGSEKPDTPPPPSQPISLPVAQMTKVQGEEYANDPAIAEQFRHPTEQARIMLEKMDEKIRKSLRKNINPGAGKGGSGSGGGRDKGTGTGTGPGKGAGQGHLNQREKRVLRWAMTFNTQNGTDYVRQLHGLGAIIALPLPGQRFKVIRDLMNPAAGRIEDISDIKRIYWVDEKPQSVQSLCTALREPIPPYFVAFFPLKLEQRLLDLELAELKRVYNRTNEDDIHETKFDVINRGGVYDVRVRKVTLRP